MNIEWANKLAALWFKRDGLIKNRNVDVRTFHKIGGPGYVKGQAPTHVINAWRNRLKLSKGD